MNMSEMVAAVKQYATTHYTEDGWDYIVETFEDEDIAKGIREAQARTPEDAIKALHRHVKILDDHRKDIQATVF